MRYPRRPRLLARVQRAATLQRWSTCLMPRTPPCGRASYSKRANSASKPTCNEGACVRHMPLSVIKIALCTKQPPPPLQANRDTQRFKDIFSLVFLMRMDTGNCHVQPFLQSCNAIIETIAPLYLTTVLLSLYLCTRSTASTHPGAASCQPTNSAASSAKSPNASRPSTTSAACTVTCARPTSCGSTRGTPGSWSILGPGRALASGSAPTARCAMLRLRWCPVVWTTAHWWRTRVRTCGPWELSLGALGKGAGYVMVLLLGVLLLGVLVLLLSGVSSGAVGRFGAWVFISGAGVLTVTRCGVHG